MIDSSGDPISGRGVGCWRLMSIQARGCMLTAVHLRRDRRKEQQQQLASYMTEHDGDVVGFGDTRLGENAGIMDRLTPFFTGLFFVGLPNPIQWDWSVGLPNPTLFLTNTGNHDTSSMIAFFCFGTLRLK